MSEIKTITINGSRYALSEPKDVLQDDIESFEHTWSSEKIAHELGEVVTEVGGGGGYSFTITITNLLEFRTITVSEGEQVILKFNYSSVDAEGMNDGPGLGQILVGGVAKHHFSAVQGDNEVNITEYLSAGIHNVSVRISNSENATKQLPYTVTIAAVSLSSPFDASTQYTGAFNFPYTPIGLAEKVMHFELDGKEIGTEVITTSGRQQHFTIPAQSHGSHVLRAWFTCDVNGITVSSNVLYYSIICYVEGNTSPIIAVTSPPLSGVEQFSNIVKKYRVFSPASLTSLITLEVDDEVVATLTVDRTEQTWTYRAATVGEITQTIRCGDTFISWTQAITESSIKVEAETEAMALYLDSYGRSNNEENPGVWESEAVQCEFINFNHVSDGWVQDAEDNTVLRVMGDARLHIPYRMFAYDFRTTGKTLEFELATRDVIDYDAEVLSCWSDARGFKITARQLLLVSEQSELGTKYKENEHIRVTFVIQKRSENRLLLCYVNGVMSGAVQYPEDDDFSQASPVGITIGSNECTIDLYTIRAYDNSLTRYQVLNNWIADTRSTEARIERFKNNDIYDDYGKVVIEKLPRGLCYLIVKCNQLPQFKGDKKTCSGYFVDLVHPERSFSFTGAEIDVQGTSSQYYWRKNYKIKFKGGFILSDGSTVSVYAMNDEAVPVSTFTMKADVASSEGAYNVVSAQFYNDLCPYQMPAQGEDPRVRYSIDGFPMVIFWDGPDGLQFMGKYNFNNDKGVPESFGLRPGDERWEVLENGNDLVGFHSADFVNNDWTKSFEGNFPDGTKDITKLQAMCAWVNSTKGNPEKFAAELADWFVPELVDWYYLYTELLLCMDQREKNVLWRYDSTLQRWWPDYYDADSIIGFNNQAQPVFDYYLEDIDHTASGDPVYNGQNSVFWQNVRATRYENIKKLYQDMRSEGQLSYEKLYAAIAAHQSNWPEAIFNEDMQAKCLDALEQNGDGTYLPFLWGKKELWTKQWLSNRFRYMDSKYEAGDSMTKRMTIRTNKMANISLASYVNMYGHVYYNAEHISIRMERDTPYVFESQASGVEDRVIGINDADKIISLGDLAPHDVELIDLSPCEMLTELKLGDSAEDYVNYSLTSATFGENKLLRKIDLRNCVAYAQAPDLSGCGNIEEIYAEGSAITGIKLPNGGILNTLHLPGTVVSLQIMNQPKLTDFSIPSYSQITTLRLENAGAASALALDILQAMPSNSRVRVLDIDYEAATSGEMDAFIAKLETMRGLDENGNNVTNAQISGSAHVAVISYMLYGKLASLATKYPSLTITYDEVAPYQTHQLIARTLSGEYENDRVTKMGAYSFYGCTALTGIKCSKVTSVGTNALDSCTGLKKIDLPSAVTADWRAFGGSKPGLTVLNLPELTTIGSYAFADTFRWYYSPIRLDFPKVTSINPYVFQYMAYTSKVTSIVRFRSKVSVNVYAFSGAGGNLHVVLDSEEVCIRSGNNDSPNDVDYIYVPSALVESYKVATGWSTIADKFRALEDYTVDGTISGALDETKI